MKKTLNFSISIQAPCSLVWDMMLGQEGYKVWTAAFTEGSYFSGSWDAGSDIHFLAPNGNGMVAVVEENRLHQHVSLRHIGEVSNGVVDTSSAQVQAWAPAYEKYTFVDLGDSTEVTVNVDTVPEYQDFMQSTFPKALNLLKALCEGQLPHRAA